MTEIFPTTEAGARAYLKHAEQELGGKLVKAIIEAPGSATAGEIAKQHGVRLTTVLEIWAAVEDAKRV